MSLTTSSSSRPSVHIQVMLAAPVTLTAAEGFDKLWGFWASDLGQMGSLEGRRTCLLIYPDVIIQGPQGLVVEMDDYDAAVLTGTTVNKQPVTVLVPSGTRCLSYFAGRLVYGESYARTVNNTKVGQQYRVIFALTNGEIATTGWEKTFSAALQSCNNSISFHEHGVGNDKYISGLQVFPLYCQEVQVYFREQFRPWIFERIQTQLHDGLFTCFAQVCNAREVVLHLGGAYSPSESETLRMLNDIYEQGESRFAVERRTALVGRSTGDTFSSTDSSLTTDSELNLIDMFEPFWLERSSNYSLGSTIVEEDISFQFQNDLVRSGNQVLVQEGQASEEEEFSPPLSKRQRMENQADEIFKDAEFALWSNDLLSLHTRTRFLRTLKDMENVEGPLVLRNKDE